MTQEEVMEQVKKKIEDIIFFKTKRFKARLILEIPELLIKAPNQDLPKFLFSEEPPNMRFGYQKCQEDMLTPKDGYVWMKVLSELEFYPDLDENEPEDHTAEDAEYHWKRDKEEK